MPSRLIGQPARGPAPGGPTLILACFLLAGAPPPGRAESPPSPRLNEMMSSNGGVLVDENGD